VAAPGVSDTLLLAHQGNTWLCQAAAGRAGEPAIPPCSAAKSLLSESTTSRYQGGHSLHSFFFLTTGMGTTWKMFALRSSVSRVTQVGRKLPLKPTNVSFSEK
jgi:hypothetical protein